MHCISRAADYERLVWQDLGRQKNCCFRCCFRFVRGKTQIERVVDFLPAAGDRRSRALTAWLEETRLRRTFVTENVPELGFYLALLGLNTVSAY